MAPLVRDMDFVRELMLKIEQGHTSFNTVSDGEAEALGLLHEVALPGEKAGALRYHLNLLVGAKFIETIDMSSCVEVTAITWAGHDFLDSIRDPVIWSKTKDGLKAAGGFSFDLLKALAKGFIRKQIEEKTGISLDM